MFSRLVLSLRVLATIAALVAGGILLTPPSMASAQVDEPDTAAQTRSTPAARIGDWLPGILDSVDDQDWFRYQLRATSTVLITLGDVPADYRLTLTGADGRPLATSDRAGTTFEQIERRLPAGAYLVQVSAGRGVADPARSYRLQLRTLADRVQVLDAHPENTHQVYAIAGQLLNNTRSWRRHTRVTARFYGAGDRYLGSATALAAQTYLAPNQRGHFRIVAARPAGTVRYALSVWAPVARPSAGTAPRVSPDQPYPIEGGRTRYVGRLTGSTGEGQVHLVRYNRIGAFVDAGHVVLSAPVVGEPVQYEIALPTYPYIREERAVYARD